MTRKSIFAVIIILVLLVLLAPLPKLIGERLKGRQVEYKFVDLSMGDIKKTVSSSGPLSPTTKVEVGSQVSGTISKVLVNYNDKVEKNQVLAQIDLSLLAAEVEKAEGQMLKNKAELEDANNELKRNEVLHEKGAIPDSALDTSRIKVQALEAGLRISQGALDFAKHNLDYGTIRSPIAGTVVTKEVEEGQTLAANFMTPRLFEIAEDLSRMEILVAVDESDIGLIHKGQRVRFTVQAYSGKEFDGSVKKIRLQPQKLANVVNYTVEVDTSNPDGLLMPGMTAEVDFIIGERTNILTVPKAALNWQPDADTLKRFAGHLTAEAKARIDSGQTEEANDETGHLWFLNDKRELAVQEVRIRLTDGSKTEVITPGSLRAGSKVISGTVEEYKKAEKSGGKKVIGMPGGGGGPPPPGGGGP